MLTPEFLEITTTDFLFWSLGSLALLCMIFPGDTVITQWRNCKMSQPLSAWVVIFHQGATAGLVKNLPSSSFLRHVFCMLFFGGGKSLVFRKRLKSLPSCPHLQMYASYSCTYKVRVAYQSEHSTRPQTQLREENWNTPKNPLKFFSQTAWLLKPSGGQGACTVLQSVAIHTTRQFPHPDRRKVRQ